MMKLALACMLSLALTASAEEVLVVQGHRELKAHATTSRPSASTSSEANVTAKNGTNRTEAECFCECSWVSDANKLEMCNQDGDHSCCWHVCCKGIGGFTVTTTRTTTTATHTSTVTATATSTTATATETETATVTATTTTATETNTRTTTETQTSTGTETTTTDTTTTETATATMTTTTTPYCFEDNLAWEPLDMSGTAPHQEKDVSACQAKCRLTEGCVHFSYWKLDGMCHLQDAFAVRRSARPGFLSGPFQCWSYVDSDDFTRTNVKTYLANEFRCIEDEVTYHPNLGLTRLMEGGRTEVVRACMQHCADTEGCEHFTVHFPSTCSLSGPEAKPVSSIFGTLSGLAPARCDEAQGKALAFIRKEDATVQGFVKAHWRGPPRAFFLSALFAASFSGALVLQRGCGGGRGRAAERAGAQVVADHEDLEQSLSPEAE